MAKELVWSDENEFVYGWAMDFENETDFIETVKSQYENGDCQVTNIQIQPCISSERGVPADMIIPLALTDISIENFYTAEVVPIENRE